MWRGCLSSQMPECVWLSLLVSGETEDSGVQLLSSLAVPGSGMGHGVGLFVFVRKQHGIFIGQIMEGKKPYTPIPTLPSCDRSHLFMTVSSLSLTGS